MIKNWNYQTTAEMVKTLKSAFFQDFKNVKKKHLKLLIKNEKDALSRKNSIFSNKATEYLQNYIIYNKVSPKLFNLRKLILKYSLLPNYISERNKIAMFYVNLARKVSNNNQEAYQNAIIGIIEGIDSYIYSKKYTLGAVIQGYIKKNLNCDFDIDYSYPFKTDASVFYFAKNYNIKLYKSKELKDEY